MTNRFQQGRGRSGKFAPKSDEHREVRSIRLTDSTWEELGKLADQRCITRADLIEQLTQSGSLTRIAGTENVEICTGSPNIESRMQDAIESVLSDPVVTRNGKDRGSVKRALQALQERLF
jgi:hypothetical protein